MRRRFFMIMMASILAFSLTGCQGGSNDETAGQQGTQKKDATSTALEDNTLSIWCWDPNFNIYAINKAAEFYAQDHEGFKIKVTEIQSDDIETKLTTAISAGDLSTLPDIFLMQDNSYQKYVTNYPDIFTDLTNSDIDFSQFSEAKVAYSKVGGKNYGIPFDNGAAVCCVRIDYLEQAGFTVEDFTDITWSDFMEKAKVVKEKTNQPMLTSQAGSPDLIMMMLQSCGSSVFNEDGSINIENNEDLKECIEIYTRMVKEGILVEVTDWDQYIASINNGTVAGVINGCWIMGSITAKEEQSGKWIMTTMPKLDNADNATNYSNNGGSSWAITSNCKNLELAKNFMRATFAGSTAFYDDLITKGALATWVPAGESDIYNQEVAFFGNDAVYAKIVDFATKTPSNIKGPFYYDARDAIGVALSNITQQGSDIVKEMKAAQETVEFNMGG